jgi:cell division protein FtsZ
MLVISNEKLHKIYGNLPASQAFKKADNIITTAVKGVAEIITLHGNINIDFADVSTVMAGSEVFIMGTGFAEGPDRAMQAVQKALESPLLDSSSIRGTKDILLNIISGTEEITMGEIGEIIDYLQEEAGMDATIIWGNGTDIKLGNQISVTIIATGFDINPNKLYQDPAEIVEFNSDDSGFDINLDDENQFDSIITSTQVAEPKRESVKMETLWEENSRKSKKNKKIRAKELDPDSANVDSWFTRQFSKFFEDKDTPISEENNK